MAPCTLTVDGRPVSCPAGATLLEAITLAGGEVPTLCHHPSLTPVGACRVCVVEATWPDGRRLVVPSCSTPVADGLAVATESAAVQRSRRLTLELLLTRAPQAPAILALARRYGLAGSRFPALVEPDHCVLCGLCVRACRELVGREAITFAGRSVERAVTAAFGQPSPACFACGSCVQLCPTRVLRFVDEGPRRRLYLGERLLSDNQLEPCRLCGRPFATAAFLEWAARGREGAPGEVVCPACARRHRATGIALPMHRFADPSAAAR